MHRYIILILLVILTSCNASKPKKHKNQSEAPISITSLTSDILNRIPFEAIQGTNPEEIKNSVKAFPISDYQVVGVKSMTGVDYFCVDAISDYIKNELRSGKTWESHLEPYILKYIPLGSVVVDIGAHIGTHTLTMSRCTGPTGKLIAFEPQPKIFSELVINMALNHVTNVDYFWGASGKENKQIELSPLNLGNEASTGFSAGGTGNFVSMIPLDSLNLTNVSFIKIDVEGMEADVLEGATQTILKNKPIMLIEICGGSLPETCSPEIRNEIFRRIQMVENLGYEVIRLCDWWDYLAIPKDSKEFKEISQSKTYRHHLKKLKK